MGWDAEFDACPYPEGYFFFTNLPRIRSRCSPRRRRTRYQPKPCDGVASQQVAFDDAGIVASQRGPGGGYRLVRDVDELIVYDIVAAVSELPRIEACPLGIAEHVNLCPLHERLDEVAALSEAAYRATTIAELIPSRRRRKGCQLPKGK